MSDNAFRFPAGVSNVRRYVGTTLENMVTKLRANLITTSPASAKEFQRILGRRSRKNTEIHKADASLKRVYPVALATHYQVLSRVLTPGEDASDEAILSGKTEDTWLNALGRTLQNKATVLFDAKELEVLAHLDEDEMKTGVYLGVPTITEE
jgi:hypothetical protein